MSGQCMYGKELPDRGPCGFCGAHDSEPCKGKEAQRFYAQLANQMNLPDQRKIKLKE